MKETHTSNYSIPGLRYIWDMMDTMERQMLIFVFLANVLRNTQIHVAIATHFVNGQTSAGC
jgi:hypothetical protein